MELGMTIWVNDPEAGDSGRGSECSDEWWASASAKECATDSPRGSLSTICRVSSIGVSGTAAVPLPARLRRENGSDLCLRICAIVIALGRL